MKPTLSVWYVAPLRRCNFKCSYCLSHQPSITDNWEWHREGDAENHRKTMEWIKRLPQRIRLRLGTAGEPFVSRAFLDSVADISHSPNLEFVEVLTNGSFTPESFAKFVAKANPAKLTLWMTYHHAEMGLEKFLEAAIAARGQCVCVEDYQHLEVAGPVAGQRQAFVPVRWA